MIEPLTPIARFAKRWVERREYKRTHCAYPPCDNPAQPRHYCSEACEFNDMETMA